MRTHRFLLAGLVVGLAILPVHLPATSVVPPDFAQMVNGSDYIVRTRVQAVSSEVRVRDGHERIFTNVELEVLEVIAGTPPTPLVLTMLGGRVGARELRIAGAPTFRVGNEDILFVQGNGRTVSPLYAMMHGYYPVLRDKSRGRAYVNRSNLVPLQSIAEVSQPLAEGKPAELLRRMVDPSRALTPQQFIQSIRNVRQTGSPRVER